MKKDKNHLKVGLWASSMSLGTLISRLFGFLRDVTIATFFDRTQTDVFFVAFRFPNFFRRFLGEGSFSASVTPVLSESLCKDESQKEARLISSHFFTLLFLTISFLTVLGVFFMDDIMHFLFKNSAYATIENKLSQTVFIGRIVFVYLFFVSTYSYFMSVSQALGRFFIPSLAPALFNISMIAFALTPASWWPFPVVSLGWAVIVGGILQVSLVLYLIYKLNFWPRFYSSFYSPFTKAILHRFFPSALALSGLSFIGIINVYFAGWLEEGTHTYIYYGDRLLELPRSLISISLGMALIPELSRLHVLKKTEDFFKTVGDYLDFLIFLTLPCALVLYLLAEPLITVLFQRGEFDSFAVSQTATILKIYSVVLITSSVARVLTSSFFSVNKIWQCAWGTMAYVALHSLLAYFLTLSQGLQGLIWATALSSFIYVSILFGLFYYSIGKIDLYKTSMRFLKTLPSLLGLGLILLLEKPVFQFLNLKFSSLVSLFFSLFLILSLGAVFYIFSGLLLKQPMAKQFIGLFTHRFSKKASL